MEPGYRITNKFLVGLRMEQIGFLSTIGGNSASLASMGINGHYYFPLEGVRPFVGLGIDNKSQRNGLGIYPRVGLEFGHMRIMIEYNWIQKMNDYVSPEFIPMMPGAQGHYETVDKSYFALKFGFFIGGGKKK